MTVDTGPVGPREPEPDIIEKRRFDGTVVARYQRYPNGEVQRLPDDTPVLFPPPIHPAGFPTDPFTTLQLPTVPADRYADQLAFLNALIEAQATPITPRFVLDITPPRRRPTLARLGGLLVVAWWDRFVFATAAAFEWTGRHARAIFWPAAAVSYAATAYIAITVDVADASVMLGVSTALVAAGIGVLEGDPHAEPDEADAPGPEPEAKPVAPRRRPTVFPAPECVEPFSAGATCPNCAYSGVPYLTGAPPNDPGYWLAPVVWRECIEHTCRTVWPQLR